MRAIWSYISRQFFSNSAAASAPIDLRAAARYSGTTPSTISTLACPRTDSARACSGVSPPSIDSATSGRAFSAATFGEVVAVEITNCVPSSGLSSEPGSFGSVAECREVFGRGSGDSGAEPVADSDGFVDEASRAIAITETVSRS